MDLFARLCESLAEDTTLREVLSEAGVSVEQWNTLDTAATTGIRTPHTDQLVAQIIAVGEDLGVDLAGRSRAYQPLPTGAPGIRSIRGWVCPHRKRCGRVDFTSTDTPTCGITGTPLRAAEGTSK